MKKNSEMKGGRERRQKEKSREGLNIHVEEQGFLYFDNITLQINVVLDLLWRGSALQYKV